MAAPHVCLIPRRMDKSASAQMAGMKSCCRLRRERNADIEDLRMKAERMDHLPP
jgi:hypothetical protein